MSFIVFGACTKDSLEDTNETRLAIVQLFPTYFPPTICEKVTMGFSQRQSLEKVLNEIAEAPIQDLSSCSPQLLEKVRDKVSGIITRDQATESASQSAVTQARQCAPRKGTARPRETVSDFSTSLPVTQPKTTQECADTVDGRPTPGPFPEEVDRNCKANGLVNSLLKKITHISKFLKRDVGKILRDGIRQSHEDPRIEDVGKVVKPTEFDELRFTLGCLSLFDDYDHFASAVGKNTKQGSQRAFGATLGIDGGGTGKLRYGIDCGKKIRRLVLNGGHGYGL
jgi:hypothetical protein